MNRNEQQVFNHIMQKKQKFIQEAIKAMNEGNKNKAIKFINFESGFNNDLVSLVQDSMKDNK